MSAPLPVCILGCGASTPIGQDVWASAAAARAGLNGFCEHPFMIDTAGEPMRIARAPWIEAGIDGVARCSQLLLPAIGEALEAANLHVNGGRRARLGLALALPSDRPGRSTDLARAMCSAISQRFPNTFGSPLVVEAGHAAGYLALESAAYGLGQAAADAYVVAGVDSYLSPLTLEWIEESEQLHGGGPMSNAWGFIPGEAAGAMVIATSSFVRMRATDVYGEVVGVGTGREANLIKTDTVCIGKGLTEAFRAALADQPRDEQIHNVFCDLNGEAYRADEYGFAALRTKERFRSITDYVAPADCWGDVGAASAPLHIALAIAASRKRYGHGPLSMTWASSEGGARGAAIIRVPEPAER